jgi:hypothetical protein
MTDQTPWEREAAFREALRGLVNLATSCMPVSDVADELDRVLQQIKDGEKRWIK